MDETERALMAEANAAGAAAQPPEEGLPPPATGDAVMEIEDDEEPEQMKIVKDYKRPEHRHAHAIYMHPLTSTWPLKHASSLRLEMVSSGVEQPRVVKKARATCLNRLPQAETGALISTSKSECIPFFPPHLHAADICISAL